MPQSAQCLECSHYQGFSRCDAFPEKIPSEIFTGLHDHREPFPGDNGIRWEEFIFDPSEGEPLKEEDED